MFVLGAHLVELYSGMSVQDFVRERIFVPLNMTSATYSWREAEAKGLMSQSWSSSGRRIPYWFSEDTAANLIAGAGGIIASSVDMVCCPFARCSP